MSVKLMVMLVSGLVAYVIVTSAGSVFVQMASRLALALAR